MLLAPARMLVNLLYCIFTGFGALGIGLIQTLGWMVVTAPLHFVALATNIRVFTKTKERTFARVVGFTLGAALFAVLAALVLEITAVGLFGSAAMRDDVLKTYAQASAHVPYLGYILLAMLATNVLSLLYEVGRMNGGQVFGSETEEESEDDENVPEVPDLENYLDAIDKIGGLDEMSKELAEEWFKKIEEMLKRGAIDPNEAESLKVAVRIRVSAVEKPRA